MDPPRLPGYTVVAWAEGCRQARVALGAAWNGMNLRAKQIACAARIAIANGAAPRGPPPPPARRPPPPPPRPVGPPGGEAAGGSKLRTTLKSRRRKLKKGNKKRTRRAH